jgi:hypothetical protein
MWVIGGYGTTQPYPRNDVWYSTNGATWTQATAAAAFTARFKHDSAVFNNKIWVIGGTDNSSNNLNDVWYSPAP